MTSAESAESVAGSASPWVRGGASRRQTRFRKSALTPSFVSGIATADGGRRNSFSVDDKLIACNLLQQAKTGEQTAAVLAALADKGYKRCTVYSWKQVYDRRTQEAANTGGPELTAKDVFGGKRGRQCSAIEQPSAKKLKAKPSLPGEVLEAIANTTVVATDESMSRKRFSAELRMAACRVMAMATAPDQVVEVVKLLGERGYSRSSLYSWKAVYDKAIAVSDGPPVASQIFSARAGRPSAIDDEELRLLRCQISSSIGNEGMSKKVLTLEIKKAVAKSENKRSGRALAEGTLSPKDHRKGNKSLGRRRTNLKGPMDHASKTEGNQ